MKCQACELLIELYNGTPKTNRDYWIMTEIFVMIHGSDICDDKNKVVDLKFNCISE